MTKSRVCEEDVLCGINVPADRFNLTDLESEHFPGIESPETVKKNEYFEVRIELPAHPNEPEHFIEWIELYSGDTFLGRAQFSGGSSFPQALFRVRLTHAEGPLKAWAKCNIHGLWESVREITIEL